MPPNARSTERRPNDKRTYQFGKSRLTLRFGDITTSGSAVIVSSDDYYLTMGGGVSGAIRLAAGDAIILDAAKKVPARLGDVVVTSAGALEAQYIFHAITIGPQRQKIETSNVLNQIISKCFDLLATLGLHSISFPAIGTGAAGFNLNDVAIHMAKVVAERLMKVEEPIDATIYLHDKYRNPLDYIQFFEEFRAQQPNLAKQVVEEAKPQKVEVESKSLDQSIVKRQGLIDSIRSLEAERDKLENELISIGNNKDKEAESIRAQINTIQDERIKLKAQLKRQTFETVELFISYAHKDETLKDELNKHLTVLQKQGVISSWHDRKIIAGEEWKDEIDTHLESAQIILLLISPDFMASNYCYEIEMERALARHNAKEAIVIPVILRPVSWSKASFSKLQALPKDGKPVATWINQDEAFVNVAEGLLLVIEQMRARPSWAK